MKINELKREVLHSYYHAYKSQAFDKKDRFLAGVVIANRIALGHMGYDKNKLFSLKFVWEEYEKITKQIEKAFYKKHGRKMLKWQNQK